MWLPLKYNYISGKMKWRISGAFTIMQFYGPDKKESRKSDSFKNAFMVKQNEKWKLLLLTYNLMDRQKENYKNEITTKI